jgi:fructose-1,6-bisphosphatase
MNYTVWPLAYQDKAYTIYIYILLVINLFLYYNNKFQRGKVDKAALEDMASCIEDLKKENENYQNKISPSWFQQ